ncbi:MAG: type IV pilin N-terminal domain-containing protein [Methanocellales archaeon]
MRELFQSEGAVSEVIGELLMTSIAVVAFSIVAAFVFSYPINEDTPHVEVQAWAKAPSTIYLKHVGGDPVDVKNLRIVICINGSISIWNSSRSSFSTWFLGDIIKINTTLDITPGMNFSTSETLEVAVFYIKSGQQIARGYLKGET